MCWVGLPVFVVAKECQKYRTRNYNQCTMWLQIYILYFYGDVLFDCIFTPCKFMSCNSNGPAFYVRHFQSILVNKHRLQVRYVRLLENCRRNSASLFELIRLRCRQDVWRWFRKYIVCGVYLVRFLKLSRTQNCRVRLRQSTFMY